MLEKVLIRTSDELIKDYAKISMLAHKHPVVITVNGKKDIVLLSHKDFLKWKQKIAEMETRFAIYAHLAQSQEDIRLRRVQSMDSAIEEIYLDIDKLKL